MKGKSFMLKKVATPLVLASFLAMALFGLASMSRGADGNMQGDCPFSAAGSSLCPQDALPGAIHHLSAYEAFLNVPVNSGITALILSLLVISIALVFFLNPFLLIPTTPLKLLYESPPPISHNKKLIRWLSLLENSPAS